MDARAAPASVDLYWLPLGAGGRSVRLNGRIYERVVAALERRAPRALYHSALEIRVPEGRYVVEQAPSRRGGQARGVVAEGAVGSRRAARWRLFRYEVRRWDGGAIPDLGEAVDSPRRLSSDEAVARRLLALVPEVPALTWGRDEANMGEMWNSNSIVAWLVTRSGIGVAAVSPPVGGRAPGWAAGVRLARACPAEMPQPTAGRLRMDARSTPPMVHAQLEVEEDRTP